ncbi:sensor histidine kinase [Thiolinea disciformis]|uniref:sensor histidine kinase n=1 Tax=Thiolinea disciformis TaxID=125614 RepID=UPI0003690B44|nr:histidine kinase [Thiolinea disciformis]
MSASTIKTLAYLPNLCNAQALWRVLAGTLLLAAILALGVATSLVDFLLKLGLHSLFAAWVVFSSLLTICLVNRFYHPTSVKAATIIIVAIVLFFTLAASLMGLLAMHGQSPNKQLIDIIFFFVKNLITSLGITLLLLRYFYIQNQWEASVEADSSAKYEALQSRMRPHFLFNSLNTVAHLVHKDPEQAEEAILDLADIMRTTLDRRTRISLQEELDVTMRYLRMEGLRLGKRRLTVVWDMDRNTLPFDMPILPLILQPLVENAIYHGIQPRKDGGTLGISLYDAGPELIVSVTNPLPPENANAHQKGNHIAQENMKNRLKLAYGDRANLQIQKTPQQYRVSFSIPKE